MGATLPDPSVYRFKSARQVLGWVALGLGFHQGGCHAGSPTLDTTPVAQEPKSRPAGMALDPVFVLPSARASASTERGVTVLATPADTAGGRELVRHFFAAVVREQYADLVSLFADQAVVVTDQNGRRIPAAAWWQQRLARLDYASLAGQVVYQDRRVETYRPEDALHLGRMPQRATASLATAGNDLLVRVPVQTPRLGRARLFGDEVWFVLRPSPNGYRIVQMLEEYELP